MKLNKLNLKNILCFLILFVILFFLRLNKLEEHGTEIDTDLHVYEKLYNLSDYYLLNESYERGYLIVISIIKQLADFEVYTALHYSLFYSIILFTICRNYNINIYITYVIGALLLTHSPYSPYAEFILRQGTGFIFLFITNFYREKNFSKKIISVLFASLFHVSFIFYIPVIILSLLIKKTKHYFYILLVSLVLYVVDFSYIAKNAISLLLPYFTYVTTESNSKYITGFKISFLLYSILPLILILSMRYRMNIFKSGCVDYSLLNTWKIYILSISISSTFLSFVPYYDRFMQFGWMTYIYLIIPYLKYSRIGMKKYAYAKLNINTIKN